MSLSVKFQNFCNDILIPSSKVSDITYRYKRITKQLNKDFWNTESDTAYSLYVGSYGRDTEIHVSDIDMLMRLPYSYYETYDNYQGNGQSALLQAIKNSIGKTYNSYIKADGQVAVVKFTDGIIFEIVPCFINKDDISYTYPDTNGGGSWKKTNPVAERNAIRDANVIWNYNLKRLCRMGRVWKDHHSVSIGGLLIDTLAYNFMGAWAFKDKSYFYYDLMVRDFLFYLYSQNSAQDYWLAPGSNHRVYREGIFEYKAGQSYRLALDAVEYEKQNMPYSANGKWREIFGSKFKG